MGNHETKSSVDFSKDTYTFGSDSFIEELSKMNFDNLSSEEKLRIYEVIRKDSWSTIIKNANYINEEAEDILIDVYYYSLNDKNKKGKPKTKEIEKYYNNSHKYNPRQRQNFFMKWVHSRVSNYYKHLETGERVFDEEEQRYVKCRAQKYDIPTCFEEDDHTDDLFDIIGEKYDAYTHSG